MSLSAGIVGLPNTGKSTLFNALTKKSVPAENFPFCTIDPFVGVVSVPDERLEKLATISQSEKVIPTAVEFVDIAGLVRGAAQGEGLGNAFLSHIREVDAILLMVRCFDDETIIHTEDSVDPVRDAEIILTELMLADVQVIEVRLGRLEKEVKKGTKEAIAEKELLERVQGLLQKGEMPVFDTKEKQALKGIGLLTIKPILYVANVGEKVNEQAVKDITAFAEKQSTAVVFLHAQAERDMSELSAMEVSADEKKEMQGMFGGFEGGVDTLIAETYTLLNLITFFTSGEKETRAWTTFAGATAPQAGRSIHSDFETKFIRAEIIHADTLFEVGSFAEARKKGLLRVEGKEYVVKDGDVITFRV